MACGERLRLPSRHSRTDRGPDRARPRTKPPALYRRPLCLQVLKEEGFRNIPEPLDASRYVKVNYSAISGVFFTTPGLAIGALSGTTPFRFGGAMASCSVSAVVAHSVASICGLSWSFLP